MHRPNRASPARSERSWGNTVIDVVVGAPTMVAAVLASPLLRRRFNRWDATDDQLTSELPGDELVPQPKLGYTRAITINAPPTTVWPWLAQIGQGRGGLDSNAATWQWQLRPHANQTGTRRIVRQRLTNSAGQGAIWRLVEPINFAMEQKMLKGIKTRAESHPSARA